MVKMVEQHQLKLNKNMGKPKEKDEEVLAEGEAKAEKKNSKKEPGYDPSTELPPYDYSQDK